MSNDLLNGLWLSFALLALNAFFAAARSALVNARRPRLRQLDEAGASGAALAARVAEDSSRLIATIRLAQALCRFSAAGVAVFLLAPILAPLLASVPAIAPRAETWAIAAVVLAVALAVLVVGELVPEALVQREPERWAIFFAPAVAALEWLLAPPARLLVRLSAAIARPLGGTGALPIVTEEEIKTMVDAGEEGGAIEQEEKEMIYSIFQFGDTLTREVMVPRIDMVAIDAETPISQAIETIMSAGHSRIPVYQDSTDNVIGVLYAKDLLRVWRNGAEARHLRDLMRPAYFVPEAKKLDDLLDELQRQRVHMALVVDEYGGIAGLVTLEDIVEEIIGEIRDEYDVIEEPDIEAVGEGEYLLDGGINLDDVNELLKAELPKDTADTLGGFVYSELGKVPVAGEKLVAGGLELKVEQVTGRRIRKVRARRISEPV
ncbi:MAG: HlyC/CorC family transporter [Chloroflexi bacterium]|nr:HlyC/CorC family transporter [Chloroflexota bacterium]